MAFAAGLGFARLGLGEAVPRVAGAAAARAAVRIDPADAGIGPGRRIELAAREDPMVDPALEAADRDRRRAAQHLAEEVVEGGENLSGLGVVAALLLVDLFLVAARRILGRTITEIVAPLCSNASVSAFSARWQSKQLTPFARALPRATPRSMPDSSSCGTGDTLHLPGHPTWHEATWLFYIAARAQYLRPTGQRMPQLQSSSKRL